MCGIVAILSKQAVNQDVYDGLTALQHRGQDAAGIMTSCEGQLFLRKGNGLVRDVFHTRHMMRLKGNMGLGHVRYPTAGTSTFSEAQPFYVNSPYGISLAHNGNLTNADQLANELTKTDRRHLNTQSDSEVLLNIFAHELQKQDAVRLTPKTIFSAISALHKRCEGAYAATAMISGQGILGFRDPYGIRPLVFGKRKSEHGIDYMFASESVALDALGFTDVEDVLPGEVVYINLEGELSRQQYADAVLSPCIFEYIYMARPDSVLDGISVYKTRNRLGVSLARKIIKDYSALEIDVVIPIPDTSRTSAMTLAQEMNIKFSEGFVKNRYIGRTFIMPGQEARRKSVQQKLNPIKLEFKNKNVLLVDDSIVRGTTSREIIQMARRAGAKKVFFASAAPPIQYANVYGIDMPSQKELIAFDKTDTEICKSIGADALIYQNLDDTIAAVKDGNPNIKAFDISVFTGEYVTGNIDKRYLQEIDNERNDLAKSARGENNSAVVDLLSY